MDDDADLIPSSPSYTSFSSSDLDTESTGSFFRDRSTTLGTLMGVTFPDVAGGGRTEGRDHAGVDGIGRRHRARAAAAAAAAAAALSEQQRRRRHQLQGNQRARRAWWRLCRDDVAERTSLGDFLQVDRRLSGEGGDGHFVYVGVGGGRGEVVGAGGAAEDEAVGGGPLFAADGRVLPPVSVQAGDARRRQRADSVGRMPVMLFTGICSGGEGWT